MTDPQTVWTILWKRAQRTQAPFEIGDVAPEIAAALQIPEREASHKVGTLLTELSRLPEGEQYFRREGNAVVPLTEFASASEKTTKPLELYPFEV
jgi:hypothetical protein